MSKYKKSIEVCDVCVEATVVRVSDGTHIKRALFMFWPWHPLSWTLEMRLKRAHKWADKIMSLAEKYEAPKDSDLSALRTNNLMRELGLKP